MTAASRFFEMTMKLPAARTHAVQVERDLRVPMPDGVTLLADRYVAKSAAAGRPPLVLVRCPYGRRGIWGLLAGRCSPSAASRAWCKAAAARSAPAASWIRSA